MIICVVAVDAILFQAVIHCIRITINHPVGPLVTILIVVLNVALAIPVQLGALKNSFNLPTSPDQENKSRKNKYTERAENDRPPMSIFALALIPAAARYSIR